MQTHCFDVTYFGTIAAMSAGAWIAWFLGLDPLGSSVLGLIVFASAPAGLVGVVSGVARLSAAPEDFSLMLPSVDDPSAIPDPSPILDVFGFDLDISF